MLNRQLSGDGSTEEQMACGKQAFPWIMRTMSRAPLSIQGLDVNINQLWG